MAGLFVIAVTMGTVVSILLFALTSFLALREFVTLAPTKPGDHRALFWSFFVVTPVQYLIWMQWYGLFSILIPVYVSIFLAIRTTLAGDTDRFLERSATNQWALMICVYFVSYVPALLMLRIPGYERQAPTLMFFLVLVVQLSDVLQYVWGKALGSPADRAIDQPEQDLGGLRRRCRLGDRAGNRRLVGHAILARGRRPDGTGPDDDGIRRWPDHVGDQAGSWRQGLRNAHRRARRRPRPDRFPLFCGAGLLPSHHGTSTFPEPSPP